MGSRFRLDDKVAVITGGANGIGKETALVFAEAGALVAVWDMAEAQGLELVAETNDTYPLSDGVSGGGRRERAAFFRTNVASQAEVEASVVATIARFGKIDILINNAGITRDAQLIRIKEGQVVGKMGEAEFDAVIAVNLKGVFNCTQAIAPHMVAQGYGRIVSASSVVGIYGNFGQTNYVATKAGVIGMTRVWARELGKRGITVNAVAPGFIGTEMVRAMPEHLLQEMVFHTPVGRIGRPEDVANTYLFLASEEAGFINGAVISVDGGLVVGT